MPRRTQVVLDCYFCDHVEESVWPIMEVREGASTECINCGRSVPVVFASEWHRRRIGDAVLERVDENGFIETGSPERPGGMCPSCGRSGLVDGGHTDDCAMTRYLEATDG